jgi:hypothetical protein
MKQAWKKNARALICSDKESIDAPGVWGGLQRRPAGDSLSETRCSRIPGEECRKGERTTWIASSRGKYLLRGVESTGERERERGQDGII